MIEALHDLPPDVLEFRCHGHVTRDDYETVLIPAVEAGLRDHEKVRLFYEIDADFKGIETEAVLEDIKVGIEHLSRWDRIAVVADIEWIRNTIKAFGFLLPGRVRVFHRAQLEEARTWISAR